MRGYRRKARIAGVLVLAAVASCAPETPEPGPAPGPAPAPAADPHAHHHGMESSASEPVDDKHAALLEIAAALRDSDDPYRGRRTYDRLLALDLDALPPPLRAPQQFELAKEHFKFGRPEEAERLFLASFEATGDGTALYLAGVSALRIGELANCLELHSPESCLFPLEGGGVHVDKAGAQRAIPMFRQVLEDQTSGLKGSARFLLNLSAMAAGEWPEAVPERYRIELDAFGGPVPGPVRRFHDRAPALGAAASNHAGGAAVDDFDGDGFLDIITSTSAPDGRLLFYRNPGDGTLVECGEEAGLAGQVGGLNLVHADYDGDGRLDLLVLRGGWLMEHGCQPRSLLRNLGGRFEDVTDAAGLSGADYPSQNAAFADYDLDGDLDLFIGNEAVLRSELAFETGGFDLPGEGDLRYPSQLFRNDGGRFTDVAAAAGVTNLRYAKGCVWFDADDDGDPDLYVSNQWGENRLYRNHGDGTFTDIAPELGVTEPIYSFPAWAWDYDGDGAQDLFVASYRGSPSHAVRSYLRPDLALGENRLYRNEGGRFRNLAAEAGLTTLTLTMGANFADVDSDGWLDFYLATGTPRFDALVPNVLYRSDGAGGFVDATRGAGLGNLQKGHGVAFGDLDNDGDEDLFLQSGGFFVYDAYFNSLYENPGHGAHWITVQLEGVDSNRSGIGSRIRVTVEQGGRTRAITRWVGPSGSFGSSSLQQEIGLGRADRIARLEVHWPASGTTQTFENVAMDHFYLVREHATEPERRERPVVKWRAP